MRTDRIRLSVLAAGSVLLAVTAGALGVPPPNDGCTGAIALGTGLTGTAQAWDNSGATTGAPGQQFVNCFPVPITAVRNDVWYTWTSPVSGAVTMTTQGTAFDTKLVVYAGATCPPLGGAGSPLACNDDVVGGAGALWSSVTFVASAGQTYLLQLGSFVEGQTGPGVLNILFPGACCTGTTCTVTGAQACAGTFQGSMTICQSPGNAVTCCRANFDQVNGITVNDIFAFVTAWFIQQGLTGPGHTADMNNDGAVNVTDIFAFISAWFIGCP
jgi:hypothetical protein